VSVEAVSAASVEPIYERFLIRSTAFCNFISGPRKNRRIPPFFPYDPEPLAPAFLHIAPIHRLDCDSSLPV
jgi:hypothetical protein